MTEEEAKVIAPRIGLVVRLLGDTVFVTPGRRHETAPPVPEPTHGCLRRTGDMVGREVARHRLIGVVLVLLPSMAEVLALAPTEDGDLPCEDIPPEETNKSSLLVPPPGGRDRRTAMADLGMYLGDRSAQIGRETRHRLEKKI